MASLLLEVEHGVDATRISFIVSFGSVTSFPIKGDADEGKGGRGKGGSRPFSCDSSG